MKNFKGLLILTIAFICFSSFSGHMVLTRGKADAWIPKDFDPAKCVLLIEQRSYYTKNHKDYYAKETAQLDAMVKKVYPYPYAFVVPPPDKVTYQDSIKYPFLLIFGSNYMQSANTSGGSSGVTIEIFDRRTGKFLPTNGWSYPYRKGILEATLKQWVKSISEHK